MSSARPRHRHPAPEAHATREYCYVPSMSCRTIVYKGLLLADQVGKYYLDLQDPACVSALAWCISASRPTPSPKWPWPTRTGWSPTGEINTVRGNFNWMRAARASSPASPVLGDDLKQLASDHRPARSDSAFDNALELLSMSRATFACGCRDADDPGTWGVATPDGSPCAAAPSTNTTPAMMEPWDGPAAMASPTAPDRRDARPQRPAPGPLYRHRRGLVMASGSGVLPIAGRSIVKKWRLQPGKMFLIDSSRAASSTTRS